MRKHHVFYSMGENCYYEPTNIPPDACLISIGKNVRISYGVEFITHDIFAQMFNSNEKYLSLDKFKIHFGTIKVFDNVCIGGGVKIMPGVKIGPNSIIAGGSVVTKDVLEGTIVGGNPAKVIGSVDDLVKRRIQTRDISNWNSLRGELEKFYWENKL